jgi:hypothetical protein
VVYCSGLALSGMVYNPLVSHQPDREGSDKDSANDNDVTTEDDLPSGG